MGWSPHWYSTSSSSRVKALTSAPCWRFPTFAAGFLTRPIGAAMFGHFGDRLGRKATLTVTLLLTGVSTFAIGVIPTHRQIGAWAPVVLVTLRLIQGLGLGGEWGGSVLISIEWEHFDKWRGFFASWPQWGAPAGMVMAAGALSLINHALGAQAFAAWGWRMPFLLSAALIGVGLYIRLGISETPDFTRLRAQNALARAPVLEVVREHWREVVLTCMARAGEQGPYYIFMTFVLAYGRQTLKLDEGMVLNFVTIASVVSMFDMPLFGACSDIIGRKAMYLAGAAALTLFAFPYYWMLDTRAPAIVASAMVVSVIIHDMMYGPQAALIAEVFPVRLRYSGASLGYQLASVVAGGPAPVIASYLMHAYGRSAPISIYLMAMGAITIVSTLLLAGAAPEGVRAPTVAAPSYAGPRPGAARSN